LNPYNSLI